MRYLVLLILLTLNALLFNISEGGAQKTIIKQSHNTPQFIKISKPAGFKLPLNCKFGENCWVMNYVDMGPDDGIKTDPACYARTYDAHKGTDLAILDEKTMEQGVDVIAPMDGVVTKVRDGDPDQWSTKEQLEVIKANRKECGNAVMIDHGEGLQTIYCHMKKGSITVKPKQKLKTGDKIGQVGLSGDTEFPHLHFGVMQDKKIIDPFTGQNNEGKCGVRLKPLWDKNINVNYQAFEIQDVGFSDEIPELSTLMKDHNIKIKLAQNSEIITFWALFFGVQKDDVISIKIEDPNREIFAENEIIQPKTRAQQFYYVGKNLKNKKLSEGVYTGIVKIKRKARNGQDIVKDKFVSILISK